MKLAIIHSRNHCNSVFDSFSEVERLVAQILVDLKDSWLPFKWGCSRKRSALLNEGAPSSSRAPSPVLSVINKEPVQDKVCTAAINTASPDTPLSFPHTQSDDSLKKPSKKRSREENYFDKIEKLTKCNEGLIGDIEIMKKRRNNLAIYNSELKAVKEKVLINIGGSNVQQHYRRIEMANNHHIQQPIVAQLYPCLGPIGIPDLNLSLEENFGREHSDSLESAAYRRGVLIAQRQAKSTEARRMRKGIIRIKAMRSACGIKLPKIS